MHLDRLGSACYDWWGRFEMDWNGLATVLTAGGGVGGRQRDPN
jgi:hypothetical protein